MSLFHYSMAGVTAAVAAVAGVYLQVAISQPDTGKNDAQETETVKKGIKLPQISVPIYSHSEKVGYCVMGVEYGGGGVDPEDAEILVPRVTNDLYIEFGSALPANADPIDDCASRVGKRTDKFVIYEAEFYEKITAEEKEG